MNSALLILKQIHDGALVNATQDATIFKNLWFKSERHAKKKKNYFSLRRIAAKLVFRYFSFLQSTNSRDSKRDVNELFLLVPRSLRAKIFCTTERRSHEGEPRHGMFSAALASSPHDFLVCAFSARFSKRDKSWNILFKRGSVRRVKKTFSSPQGRRRLHLAGRHISFIFVSFTSRPSLDSRAIYS